MGVLVKRTKHDIGKNLVIVHIDVAYGNAQTQDLLELEFDGGPNLGDLVVEVLSVGYGSRELSSLGKTGTKETRDLLDESF